MCGISWGSRNHRNIGQGAASIEYSGAGVYTDIISSSGHYALAQDAVNRLWGITDTHLHKTCCYSAEGLLLSVTDKNGCSLVLEYHGAYPEKMVTVLRYEIHFTFRDGRLVRLEDGMGRTMQYRYRGGFLTEVVHMDGGVSRYAYTEDGYLSKPTDQTGVSYLTNRYDRQGRVVLQTLANGETYQAGYLDRERKVCVEYSGHPGEKIYSYQENMAVTEVLYPDGTKESFAFDARYNRILEMDREGRSIRKEYDASGRLINVYANGAGIKGSVSKSDRRGIGHIHGQH